MSSNRSIAYLCAEFPTASQTFIAREIRELRRQGIRVEVYSCCARGGGDRPSTNQENGKVHFFYFSKGWEKRFIGLAILMCLRQPLRAMRVFSIFFRPRLYQSKSALLDTLWGVYWALAHAKPLQQSDVGHLHAVWATMPATAAFAASVLADKSFSFGAQAFDLYRDGGDPLLAFKIRESRFIHTTTSENVTYLKSRGAPAEKIVLARRGLESLSEVPVRKRGVKEHFNILSVGRLVEKKGHVIQLEACRALADKGLSFTLRIVGEGPLRDELEALTEKLELSHAVRFLGEASYSRVEEIYRESDVFWHTGIVALNGDRDGLPNVIPEAFLHGVPVIATDLPGSNEAVRHGVSGWVVSRPQSQDLASAVVELLSDEVLRAKVIEGGHEWVRTHFNLAQNIRPLAQAFRDTLSRERE